MQRHYGMHRAIVFQSFGVEPPGRLKGQPLAVLEKGMRLYRELTARLDMWDGQTPPDTWIRGQLRLMATHAPAPARRPPTPAELDALAGLPSALLSSEEEAALAAIKAGSAEDDPHAWPGDPGAEKDW